MKSETLTRLETSLTTVVNKIYRVNPQDFQAHLSQPLNLIDMNQFEMQMRAKKQLESYAKNLYASFFLKKLKDKNNELTNDALINAILDYFDNYRTLSGCRFDSLCTALSILIKNFTPIIGSSRTCKEAKNIVGQMSTQLGTYPQNTNRFDWSLVVNAFGPTEDTRHPEYREAISSVKNAMS